MCVNEIQTEENKLQATHSKKLPFDMFSYGHYIYLSTYINVYCIYSSDISILTSPSGFHPVLPLLITVTLKSLSQVSFCHYE